MNKLELFLELLKMQNEALREIEANNDPREKTIGDKVEVWDGSYFTDEKGNRILITSEKIESIPYFIVVGTNQKTTTKILLLGDDKVQDLLIVDPKTNNKYRTCSQCVKILDKITDKEKK
jgi:hypothetical protein